MTGGKSGGKASGAKTSQSYVALSHYILLSSTASSL